MTDAPTPQSDEPAHDPEVMELAQKIFSLARHGDTDTIKAYVDAGVPANLTNDKGDSLIMLASYYGHAAAVRALLERGADPDKTNDKGQTPLAGAVFKGEYEVVRALVDGGADPRAGQPSAVESAELFEKPELLALFGADQRGGADQREGADQRDTDEPEGRGH
jgi:ankyrin repeat protein